MKANEFRIGNYCIDEKTKLLLKVCELSENIVFIIVDRENYPLPDGWQAKPIPITEEWLLNFGFKKWTNRKIWNFKRFKIYYHSKDGFCYGLASFRTKIKYIHQLQNLYFALTGKELELCKTTT